MMKYLFRRFSTYQKLKVETAKKVGIITMSS